MAQTGPNAARPYASRMVAVVCVDGRVAGGSRTAPTKSARAALGSFDLENLRGKNRRAGERALRYVPPPRCAPNTPLIVIGGWGRVDETNFGTEGAPPPMAGFPAVNSQFRIEDSESPIANHQLPITNDPMDRCPDSLAPDSWLLTSSYLCYNCTRLWLTLI